MKEKKVGSFWAVTAVVLLLSLVLPWTVLAKVWTDLEDYSPGDIVTIHGDNSDGAGYLSGETVHVAVSGPNGYIAACDAVADATGTWSCEVMLWPDYLAVGTYNYAATGLTSQVTQTGTFTDGNLKFHETGLPSGTLWTVDWYGVSQTVAAPIDIVFGGPQQAADYSVTSPLAGEPGVQYVASPASGSATRPQNGTTTVNISFATQYQVSFAVNPSGGGSTSPSATAYYNAGSTISISATPASGYAFSSWSASGSITFASASSTSTTATINGTGTVTANFDLADSTPPTTSIALSPASPNGLNGWYVTDVHVTVSAADNPNPGGSGVAETRCVLDPVSAPASFDDIPAGCAYTGTGADVTTEGQHTVYAASKDNAGNKESPVSKSFKIDKTKPTIVAEATTTPNAAGWYNSDVTVHFTCSDALSGIPAGACPADQVLSTEGEAVASTANSVTDAAGNTSDPSNVVTVKIDKTAPTVAVTGVVNGAAYTKGSVPVAGCSTSDNLSGVQTYATVGVTGGAAGDPNVGTFVATCSGGKDNADNTAADVSVTYYVHYSWTGFFQPIDNRPVRNAAKAGSSIPVKFNLGGYQGLSIFDTGYPKFIFTACDTQALDNIETYTAGNSSLTYDFQAQQYVYVWKTDRLWASKCGYLEVKLIDGTSHFADFKLK